MYRKDKQFMKNPATAAARVYIGSIAKTVISNDLEDKFKVYGNILGLVLNSGFGFIQYETEAEAQSAIQNENGAMLHGRKIVVKQALDKSRPGGNQGREPPKQGGFNAPQTKGPPNQQQRPGPNQSPRQNNPPPQQKTPPPPQTPPQPPAPKNIQPDPPMKFQPPERGEPDFQDDNMEDDRPNIRPPGPGPTTHNEDRGRRNNRKPRGGRGDGRGRSNERDHGRDHYMDRFEPPPKGDNYRDAPYYGRDERNFLPPVGRGGPYPSMMDAPPAPEKNDCEIIVVSKQLTEYAEFIEQKLKTLGLVVDLLFPNEDVPIGKVLANISSRGCLYAILVMPQNEEHRSLTLNILHGIPQEHRNMPIEDALILMSRNFESYMKGEQVPPDTPGQNLSDRHPTAMQMMLNLLAENRQLTSIQYEKLIKYLEDRRELQHQYEITEGITPDSQESDPKQAELQSRILNILNKSNDTPIPASITAPDPAPPAQTPILKDPTVQKALDSLLLGDMFKTIATN